MSCRFCLRYSGAKKASKYYVLWKTAIVQNEYTSVDAVYTHIYTELNVFNSEYRCQLIPSIVYTHLYTELNMFD